MPFRRALNFAMLHQRRLLQLVTSIFLLVIFIEAAHVRFAHLPKVPISDRDTWGYLSPALAKFTTGDFLLSYRSFPYPGFLWLILKTTHQFSAIVITQALVSLAGGGLLGLAWLKLRRFLPEHAVLRIVHAALGLLLLASWLFAARHILLEHTIRPEPVFIAFSALQLWLELGFIEAAFVTSAMRKALLFAFFAVFNALLLYLIKPEWGLAVFTALLPPVVAFFAGKWRTQLAVTCAGAALAFYGLFWFPESVFHERYSPEANFLPSLLFCMHANMIRPEIERDLAVNTKPPYRRSLLKIVSSQLDVALHNPPGTREYRSLGYDPDYILYRAPTLPLIRARLGSAQAFSQFCFHYYWMAWLHQPTRMAGKILGELHLFYRFNSEVSESQKSKYLLVSHYRSALGDLRDSAGHAPNLANWPPFTDYVQSVQNLSNTVTFIRQQKFLLRLYGFINCTYLLCLLAVLASAAVAQFLPAGRKINPRFKPCPLLLAMWLFSFNLGMTLTVSIVHSMKIGRFTQVQMTYTLFSYFAGALLLLGWLFELRQPPTPPVNGSAAEHGKD
jgi:hypothetical protein